MKARHLLLAAGLALAASLAVFGDKTPAADIAEPVTRAAQISAASSTPATAASSMQNRAMRTARAEREPTILVLQPRDSLIGGAGSEKPAEGLFGSQTWTPPPPPPPKPAPPPPPTAPPLPFTYLGKKVEDNTWEVYLARGDQTFIVRQQTVIEDTYRVDSIKLPTISLTYLPLNQVQTLTIGGID
jgi:hypothetical protein